jgi:glucose-6-phosphate isomerase, archaeal
MQKHSNKPYTLDILNSLIFSVRYDNHVVRKLSSLNNQFLDQKSYLKSLAENDSVVYQVYEVDRPKVQGELLHGISVVHPGKVGDEYFMTKGHFHTVLNTAEVYFCVRGTGFMVMETPEGDWAVEALRQGLVLYVPPRWAHRSVNTDLNEDLVTFFIYPANAGHDYGLIEKQGYRKLVIERNGNPIIVDNPRWISPEER